jgi:hypothetical protein
MNTPPALPRLYTPKRFNRQTRQRFFRRRKAELAAHCGGSPSAAQQILIYRICQNEFELHRLDARMMFGEISGHAARMRFAMENRLRLDLRDLGLKAVASREPTLAEHLARRAEERASGHGNAAHNEA